MQRRLVVCCDGTWNKPRSDTNVYRTFHHLREALQEADKTVDLKAGWEEWQGTTPDDARMILYYDQGVGTQPWDWAFGGAAGVGLSDNVRQAYRFLARHY